MVKNNFKSYKFSKFSKICKFCKIFKSWKFTKYILIILLLLLLIYFFNIKEGFSQGIRYIRIVNSLQSVSNYIQIGELKAFDMSGNNVALGKPTTSSEVYPSFPPNNANDNNPNTFFHSAHPPKITDFWEVDLGQEYNIEYIEFYNRADCCKERIIGCTMNLMTNDKKVVEQFNFTTNEMVQKFVPSFKGEKGSTGSVGATGAVGAVGATGAVGETGQTGQTGSVGPSITEEVKDPDGNVTGTIKFTN